MNYFEVKGEFVEIDGKEYYKITDYDYLEPFLFTLVSANDIWIYISSTGAVTAGRKDIAGAIFPYISEDKLYHTTDSGVKTLVRIIIDGKTHLWEPFSSSYIKQYKTKRNIYKNILGNEVIFEEINTDLGMCFKYKWQTCEEYGLVKTAYLENLNSYQVKAEIIDGFINILPYGIKPVVQTNWSSLADGYKKTEIIGNSGGVIYAMTSSIADTPSPEEMLKANFVWNICDFNYNIYASETALTDFAVGEMKERKTQYYSERGAYLMHFDTDISSYKSSQWMIMADIGLDQVDIANFLSELDDGKINSSTVCRALEKSENDLKCILAKGDGIQYTGDKMSSVHHMSNVSFNNMRGGLFLDNYKFDYYDFIDFIKVRDKDICEKYSNFFEKIKDVTTVTELKEKAKQTGEKDLIRMCFEYLPISFSRRHGDPSRPWNDFSIILKKEDGSPITNYQGNWRDIFQNWEAMCLSFPEYLDSIISKFLNASTSDGFNPYKISRDGIEWEKLNPDDPCATIGYWGDHQIIYLTRLIEWLKKYNNDNLRYLIEKGAFTYADVPYEIVCFDRLIQNPEHTITHNMQKDKAIMAVVEEKGTDYKLVNKNGEIYYAVFAEKLMVPILAKMSNLVPGGGIWMNTQRPEWNDANNAIVGYGLSVVTVCHLKRHLNMCKELFDEYKGMSIEISCNVFEWLENTLEIMKKYSLYIDEMYIDGKIRMSFLRELGVAADAYKKEIYTKGFSDKCSCSYDVILEFITWSLKYIDFTINSNKSDEGLYHSYNLIDIRDEAIEIKHLKPMLEGQVAVLGCNSLNGSEAVSLLNAMKSSGLYSELNKTYYLYPITHTKDFMDKNIIPAEMVSESVLIQMLLKDKNTIIVKADKNNTVRFNPEIYSNDKLKQALEKLKTDTRYSAVPESEYEKLLGYFEEIFRHKEFMGRSQVLYKYEGIGSVYWHQNSKLLVSVQETLLNAYRQGENEIICKQLNDLYYEVRNGLGFNKTPQEWGAFPVDAYSHTPYNGGAKQPGMTGQVKEEIITRFSELGVVIEDGKIRFDCDMVRECEFLNENTYVEFIRLDNTVEKKLLDKSSLAFTLCQTPVIYTKCGNSGIKVKYKNGKEESVDSHILPESASKKIFNRNGDVDCIIVNIQQ